MTDLVKEPVNGVVESVLKEILKKTTGRTATKRKKKQTRSTTTGRFVPKSASSTRKPADARLPAVASSAGHRFRSRDERDSNGCPLIAPDNRNDSATASSMRRILPFFFGFGAGIPAITCYLR